MTLESDLKREQMYLKFKEEEPQRNCEHEEKMAARAREHKKFILGLCQEALIKEITFSPHLQLTCTQ